MTSTVADSTDHYGGVVTGKYLWASKLANTQADPVFGGYIHDYAWSDELDHVSIYISLAGVDGVSDEDIKLSHEENSVSLRVHLKSRHYLFEINELNKDISDAQLVRKRGKDKVLVKLQKKDAQPWTELTKGRK